MTAAESSSRIAELERQNADLVAANNRYLERARKAERERDELLKAFAAKGEDRVIARCDAMRDALIGRFQTRVGAWLAVCFGASIARDKTERSHRFLEEAIELVQACGATAGEAHQLVDYVYGRPVGDRAQEIGGVMLTLAALCLAYGDDMFDAGEAELARVWMKIDNIRAKQAAKPRHSPLPGPSEASATPESAP